MYDEKEFWYPYFRMQEAGYNVKTIGAELRTYYSKKLLEAEADTFIGAADPEDFSALVIPGGYGPDHMRRSPEMVEFVTEMHEEGKPIAAICHGPWLFASADIINGKKLTSFYSIKDDLVNAGAEWVDQPVVVDGNIITSRNPADLPRFCRVILEKIKK